MFLLYKKFPDGIFLQIQRDKSLKRFKHLRQFIGTINCLKQNISVLIIICYLYNLAITNVVPSL